MEGSLPQDNSGGTATGIDPVDISPPVPALAMTPVPDICPYRGPRSHNRDMTLSSAGVAEMRSSRAGTGRCAFEICSCTRQGIGQIPVLIPAQLHERSMGRE